MLISIIVILLAILVLNNAFTGFANAGKMANEQGGLFLAGIAAIGVYGGIFYFAFG